MPVSIHEKKLNTSRLQNPCMRAVAKLLRAQAGAHLYNFCERFEERSNFTSTYKVNGTIQYSWNRMYLNKLLI